MTETTALVLIVFAVVAAAMLAYALLGRGADTDTGEEPARRAFGAFTPAVAGMVPTSTDGRAAIQQDLWLAGYYQPTALGNFLAVRNLATVIPLIAGLAFALLAPNRPLFFGCLIAGVVVAALGYSIPRVSLASEAKGRKEKIRRGVPIFMDTLGLCLSTGNSLPESFRRTGEAIRRGHPDIATDSSIVSKQARLRSMDHALDQWRRRTPLPEIGSLCFLLSQSDRLGTDAAKGLWELSASYRVNARQDAEAAANRTNFYLLFPTVLCLLMAAAIVMIGPGVLNMVTESRRVVEEIEKGRKGASDAEEELNRQLGNKPKLTKVAPPPQPSASIE